MALIKCTGCGQMISDKAKACPKCKTPIEQIATKPIQEGTERPACGENVAGFALQQDDAAFDTTTAKIRESKKKPVVLILCLILIVGLVGGLIYLWNENHQLKQQAPQITLSSEANGSQEESARITASQAVEEDGQLNGSYSLDGTISQYKIHMDVTINGNEVWGTYSYDSQPKDKKMTVKGTFDENNTMYLSEYDPAGDETGYFNGNFDGNTYEGVFSNYSRNSNLNFYLETL